MAWTEAQKRYARSDAGRKARKKYQLSPKGIAARKKYMLKKAQSNASIK